MVIRYVMISMSIIMIMDITIGYVMMSIIVIIIISATVGAVVSKGTA